MHCEYPRQLERAILVLAVRKQQPVLQRISACVMPEAYILPRGMTAMAPRIHPVVLQSRVTSSSGSRAGWSRTSFCYKILQSRLTFDATVTHKPRSSRNRLAICHSLYHHQHQPSSPCFETVISTTICETGLAWCCIGNSQCRKRKPWIGREIRHVVSLVLCYVCEAFGSDQVRVSPHGRKFYSTSREKFQSRGFCLI